MPFQVVVTRPAAEARRWAEQLRQAGWFATELPLLAFAPPADAESLVWARAHLTDHLASMWVSPQAVEAFGPSLGGASASGHRFWAPGPGTAQALLRAGVSASQIDQPLADASQFDSDALWQVVAPQVRTGFQLLLVHGDGEASGESASQVPYVGKPVGSSHSLPARERLAIRVRAEGGAVRFCVAYHRGCPQWAASEQRRALDLAHSGAVWLFSSSEAVGNLSRLLPRADWSLARAMATHPRIANAARGVGFGEVQVCRPALPDVLAALRDMSGS